MLQWRLCHLVGLGDLQRQHVSLKPATTTTATTATTTTTTTSLVNYFLQLVPITGGKMYNISLITEAGG